MNEADPKPINLDELRLLPDWLREDAPPPSKQYASHDGPVGDDRGGNRQGGRSGSFGRDRRDGGRPPAGGGGRPPDRKREAGRSGPPPRGGQSRPDRDDRRSFAPPPAPPQPAPVRVEFLPDEACLASINKQIRSTHLAYPLFGLARMFLQEPERHWVQFTLTPGANTPASAELSQLGEDGPIALDRQVLEKAAFDLYKDRFYTEQTEQKEPLKGNFTNVARCRLSGTLLGPTNYHAYQPALRSLYESRFSRRMSFDDFKRNIEIVTDPAVIERWKEEARTTTTIVTIGEETPTVLPSQNEARAHFRQHHLSGLLRSGTTLKVHGSVARTLPEPAMMQAIREAHDRELRYPAQFVQMLRQGFQDSGLHIFKHRKRFVYVSLARPTPFVAHGAVSPNVAAILAAIAESPLCTRKMLAERVLGKPAAIAATAPEAVVPAVVENATSEQVEPTDQPEQIPAAQELPSAPPPEATPVASDDGAAKGKAALAADLRFLVQSGHIIEFHNGTFDLPIPPRAKEEMPARGAGTKTHPKARADHESAANAIGQSSVVPVEAEDAEIGEASGNFASTERTKSHEFVPTAVEAETSSTPTDSPGTIPEASENHEPDAIHADHVHEAASVESVVESPSSEEVEGVAPQP